MSQVTKKPADPKCKGAELLISRARERENQKI